MVAKRSARNAYANIEKQYIVFYDSGVDLSWPISHVEKFKEMWGAGEGLIEISKELKRDIDEVTLLIIDLAKLEEIEKRPTGIYGQERGSGGG